MKYIAYILIAFACIACISPMDSDLIIDEVPGRRVESGSTRTENSETRNVLLLYSAGYNSLWSYLKEDISDLMSGWLPGANRSDNILLVYSHQTKAGSDYKTPTSPVLFRLLEDENGESVADTLVVYEAGTISTSAVQLNKVLKHVQEAFPAKGYGMIFSSHATGYLPAGFYANPKSSLPAEGLRRRPGLNHPVAVPSMDWNCDPSLPAVKSIGEHKDNSSGHSISYEIELDEFVRAIPMKLDYLLFDACLMGGVEVAYEFKDKCDIIAFSQTEVLAEGFDYKTLAAHLLGDTDPDPVSVCDDYYQQYARNSGVMQSATISAVRPALMGRLAEVCRNLFQKYRTGLESLNPKNVQKYFRSSFHWFYDLESIIYEAAKESGAGTQEVNEDIRALREALKECIIYKAATPYFMNEFHILTYSGLSMYLPANGSDYLDAYYRRLKWNIDTSLVE